MRKIQGVGGKLTSINRINGNFPYRQSPPDGEGAQGEVAVFVQVSEEEKGRDQVGPERSELWKETSQLRGGAPKGRLSGVKWGGLGS